MLQKARPSYDKRGCAGIVFQSGCSLYICRFEVLVWTYLFISTISWLILMALSSGVRLVSRTEGKLSFLLDSRTQRDTVGGALHQALRQDQRNHRPAWSSFCLQGQLRQGQSHQRQVVPGAWVTGRPQVHSSRSLGSCRTQIAHLLVSDRHLLLMNYKVAQAARKQSLKS